MKPLDLIRAAAQAHTLWPDGDIRGDVAIVDVNGVCVGRIDCADGSVTDVVTGERYA